MIKGDECVIPKIVHYCWFGNNPKSKLIKKCIASWKKFLPEWEIIEWNESNYDVYKNEYISAAYKEQKWAFVVDFARFDILNEYGGVFFDADVELLKTIPETLLEHQAFTGFETEKNVAPGLVFASTSKHPMLAEIINVYENKKFGEKIDGKTETIVDIVTNILEKNGLVKNNLIQDINGIVIYPKEFFCCFNHETQNFEIQPETISIHHYAASWSPWYRKTYFKIIKIAAGILGKERYLKIKRKIKK